MNEKIQMHLRDFAHTPKVGDIIQSSDGLLRVIEVDIKKRRVYLERA